MPHRIVVPAKRSATVLMPCKPGNIICLSRTEDYAVIEDLHTAATVGRGGSIDWMRSSSGP